MKIDWNFVQNSNHPSDSNSSPALPKCWTRGRSHPPIIKLIPKSWVNLATTIKIHCSFAVKIQLRLAGRGRPPVQCQRPCAGRLSKGFLLGDELGYTIVLLLTGHPSDDLVHHLPPNCDPVLGTICQLFVGNTHSPGLFLILSFVLACLVNNCCNNSHGSNNFF